MTLKMKIKILAFTIILFFVGFIAVKNLQAQVHVSNKAYDTMLSSLLTHSVNEVDVDAVAKAQNIFLLDAREYDEYKVSHIAGAYWVGYDDFKIERVNDIPKDAQVIVYCSVGYRSEKVAEKIQQSGYTNVSNLYGGIFEWVNTGKLVVNTQNAPTQQVHAYDKSWGVWLQRGEKVYD